MGLSARATLAYGICPWEEGEEPWGVQDPSNWLQSILPESGVAVVDSGHCNYSRRCALVARASRVHTDWSSFDCHPDLRGLIENTTDFADCLLHFCVAAGIPWREPSWLLFAYYG